MLAALLALSACQEATVGGSGTAPAESAPPALEPVALPQSDGAGNQMVALEQIGEGGLYCAGGETWCVVSGDGAVSVSHDGGDLIALPARGEQWPNAIISADSAIVGVITTETQPYSGGGGSASRLTLYQVSGGVAREVAVLPVAGSADVRACFTPEDEQQRAGACRDEYRFVTRISLDESVTSGAPRIVLETSAGSYPGRVTRQADSLERAPLTEADLVWWHDDVCSFRRTFSPSPAGPYVADAELPACSDYLEP
jgi:hypothetical protein